MDGEVLLLFNNIIFKRKHFLLDKGRLFDKNGNLNKWWTDSAIKTFHEKAKCLIHQYNNYTLSDIGTSIDGENTQGYEIKLPTPNSI